MMFFYDHNLSAWGWVGMTLGMIAFWAVVIYAIVWIVRSPGRVDQPWARPQPPAPEQLLAERFARGEIDEPEYHQRLNTLTAQRPAVRS
jgi:putative membrane protein